MKRVVLIGGGPAAVAAAATLREEGFDGEVFLVTDDDDMPYERPPLSKEFLSTGEDPPLLRPSAWYAEQEVNLLTATRVVRLDAAAQHVTLDDGAVLDYDALLLATGVRARPGVTMQHERILSLRARSDARRLRETLVKSSHVVLLGGGFIGSEIAATAVAMGRRVTIVERTQTLMERALGPDLGGVMTDLHRSQGVDLRLGRVVAGCQPTAAGLLVRTDTGTIEGDLVIVGAGCDPNTELATQAGIRAENGIVTDQFCRTSAVGVLAAGDVASSFHPWYGEHIRVEHHDTALRHGAAAARSMLGSQEPFAEAHWFWSDQYGHNLQQVGRAAPGDQMVVRGSLDDLSFTALWLRGSRITKAIAVNRPREALAVRKALFADHEVRADELTDPAADLRRLTRPTRAA